MGTGSGPEGPSPGIHLSSRQIYGFAFTNNFCIAILYLNLPLRAMALGADAFHLGLVGGVWSLSAICAAVLSGRLSDRIGRDGLMTLGNAGYRQAANAAHSILQSQVAAKIGRRLLDQLDGLLVLLLV